MKNEFLKSHEEMQLEDFCHALNRENNIIQDQLTEYRIKHEIACSTINLLQKKCDVRGKALSLQCKETKELQQQLADSQKREVMLRDALEYHQAQTRPIQRTEEALAATAAKEQGE